MQKLWLLQLIEIARKMLYLLTDNPTATKTTISCSRDIEPAVLVYVSWAEQGVGVEPNSIAKSYSCPPSEGPLAVTC